ncbi:MAG: sulfatase-like hydrolase/transferase [Cyclobacteriaceae bacterium]
MRKRLLILGYLFIFWLTYEVAIRAVFLLYNHDFSEQLLAFEILKVFLNGLKMDLSLVGYLLMASALLFAISMFVEHRWPYFLINVINIVSLIISTIIMSIDLELYRHWGFRLNTTPLFYIKSAGPAALGSVELTVVFKVLLVCAAIITLFLFAYDRLLMPKIDALNKGMRRGFIVLLIFSALMIIPMRGSFTVAPMNSGFVYFHKTKAYANHAAINVIWNFFYHLRKSSNVKYPENFLPEDIAIKDFKELYPPQDSTVKLWRHAKPNIILFILESFTADVVGALGGLKDVTPNLNALCEEGILFTNFYASGDRTDKGLVSILSGYPAQPQTSIVKETAKTQRLPYLNHYMHSLGYKTSFVYGGDIDFANFRSFLTYSNFDNITADENFPDELNQSKWGVQDHIVFQRALQECDTTDHPFFKVILSLSSHEPFDVPMIPHFSGKDAQSLFLNSCYYTDKSLGDFVIKAKASSWWNNTVILFVADHGHRLPGNKELKDKERFRIPFLMIGGPVKRDTIIQTFANQTDIANTILGQLDKPSPSFTFSKNILSPSAESFAVYFFNDGYGFVTEDQYIIYDNTGKQFLRKDGASPEDLERSKSYQQILYSDYNHK